MQPKEILELTQDPEMAIFKAIRVVDNKLDEVAQEMRENISSIEFPEQKETDLLPICERLDVMQAKMDEPITVTLEIV